MHSTSRMEQVLVATQVLVRRRPEQAYPSGPVGEVQNNVSFMLGRLREEINNVQQVEPEKKRPAHCEPAVFLQLEAVDVAAGAELVVELGTTVEDDDGAFVVVVNLLVVVEVVLLGLEDVVDVFEVVVVVVLVVVVVFEVVETLELVWELEEEEGTGLEDCDELLDGTVDEEVEGTLLLVELEDVVAGRKTSQCTVSLKTPDI